jgi:dipeptidyl aminopeptidase/acylaminoacyl peptidase
MRPLPIRAIRSGVLFASIAVVAFVLTSPRFAVAAGRDEQPSYGQLTDRPAGSGFISSPVLSADGSTAVYAESPPAPVDPADPNRIVAVALDDATETEVDAYAPLCACESIVDVSADGATVVSSDSMQVRIATARAGGRILIALADGAIGAIQLTADGATVYFLVDQDTTTADGATALPSGIWMIAGDGGEPRQVVSFAGATADDPAAVGHVLDVSADGRRLVFLAGDVVVAVEVADGTARRLFDSATLLDSSDMGSFMGDSDNYIWATNVAISADGDTVAFNGNLFSPDWENVAPSSGAATLSFAGGEARLQTVGTILGELPDPVHLSADGSLLLVDGALIDLVSGERWELANRTPDQTWPLRATLSADGTRILFVVQTPRGPDQLAVIEIRIQPEPAVGRHAAETAPDRSTGIAG